MGRHNQQRRKMKAKARRRKTPHREGSSFGMPSPGGFFAPMSDAGLAESRVRDLADQAVRAPNQRLLDDVVERAVVVGGERAGPRAIASVFGDLMREMITAAWEGGWEPADLHRLVGRRLTGVDQEILLDLVVEDLARYATTTVDPRWVAQLSELDAETWWPSGTTWLTARLDTSVSDAVRGALRLVHLMARLPILEPVGVPPGQYVPLRGAGVEVDDRILSRVRALLAKAESTTFEAEAETFTAGAQSLMARHSIDAAVLAAADQRPDDAPQPRRIGIDPPYETPKVALLDGIASANRCRTVWSKEFGFVTVVGFRADLDAAETLFTSLLIQSTRAMAREGKRTYAGGRSRTRSFRQSFLTAFAYRIGERLQEATDEALDDAVHDRGASGGRELVPLMSARAEKVDDAFTAMFPELTFHSAGAASDAEGWASGRRAADQAALSHGESLERASG